MPWVEITDEEEDIIPLEAPVAPVAPKEDFFATREEEVASGGKGPNYPQEEAAPESRWQEVTEEPTPQNVRGQANRERLSGAIAQLEEQGYTVPHFIGTPGEPEGDRAPTMDMESLVEALAKRAQDLTEAGKDKEAAELTKEIGYWEDKIETEGMSAEQWRKQTGEPDPSYESARWQEVTEEPSTSNYRELQDVGIVTAYRPGGNASMGLNAGIEGADLDAHDTPILGRTTFEDYIDGRGDYVTVAMDKNSSWQNQFLSSPNFPGMVFQVRDNGGYGNGKTGENWIDIAFTDPQKAKSMLLRGVPFTPITPEQAQTMSASRENITHTPRLQALYVPGGSFSQKEETGLPDPFMEFTARTARGVETGTREMFGGALNLIESAFEGERNVYADKPEQAEGDIAVLEEQVATLQKELRDRVLKDDPASADWALSTTFDSPELGKLDKQLKDARRAAAGDVTESVMGQVSRQTERLAIEAEQNQVAAMRKWEPYITASRNTKWGMQLGDALGRTVPGVLTSLYNPILGAAAIYAQIYQSSLQQYLAEKPDATREEAQKFANDQALVQAPWALAGNQLTARALKASFTALPAGAVERGARIFGTQLGQAVAKNAQAFVGNVGSAVGQSVTSDMVSEDYDLLEDTTLGEKVARAKEPASLAAGVSAVFGAAGMGVAAAKRPAGAKPKAEPAPKEVPTKEIELKALPAPAPKGATAEPKAAEEKALAVRPPKYSPEEAALLKEEAAKAPPPALPPSKSIVGPVPTLAPGEIGPSIEPLFQIPSWRKKIQFTLGSMVAVAKDISPIRNYRRFWIGTAEVFESAPGLEGLGKAIRDYIDDGLRINARDTNPFRLWEKSVNAKEKAQAHDEFYRFFMQADDAEVSVQKLAIPTYWTASDRGRELIDLTRDYFNRSGIENQAEGVQVFDPKLNKYRPIGRIGSGDPIPPAWYPGWKAGYFPRMVNRDVMKTLKNPKDDPVAYQGVLDEMAARGFNPAEANDYISNILRASTSNDYFASMDLARTADLPTKMNDYTFETVRRYISARSHRLAQIRNFGQKTGPDSKDLFEQYHAIASGDVTKTYINNVRSQILNVELVGPFRNFIRGLGTGLTGLHLGNWRTAMRNALSGQSMVATQYGIKRYAEGVIDSFHNINDAYEKGIIVEDLFNLVGDGPNLGGRSMIQKGTDFLLKWSGEVPAENFNRVVNMGAAKALLRDAIAEYKNKGPTKKLVKYMGHFKRLGGIDPQALLDEGGAGPHTDRYLRQSVKRVQGGYQIDQVPAFLESDAGRFFLKYNKWGTQQTDMFMKEVIRPAIRSLTFGKYKQETVEVRNPETGKMETKQVPGDHLKTAAAYFIILAGAGATAAQFDRHILGIEDMSESLAEIIAKKDKDAQAAFFASLGKLWQYQLVMGIGGSIGNYAQWGVDWTERKRFKDPLTPPGLEFIKSTAQLWMDAFNQGRITLADVDGYLRKNWSAYRTGKQLMAYLGNDVYPAGFRALQVESMRQDLSWMRNATRRFEKEEKIEAPPGGPPSGMGKNPMTPFNRNLNEALLLGDIPEASRLVRERLRSAGRDAEVVMESIMDSVRARRPIKAGGSTSESTAQNFMQWADENMSAADAAKIRRIDKTYTNTAIAAGILSPGKEKTSEDIAEDLRKMQLRTEMRNTR